MSKIVSFTGTIKRTVYDSDRFAVYAVAVPDDVITQNHMKKSKYGDITVSGNISGLSDGSIYDFTCEEQQTKHGYSYDAKKCVGSSDETSEINNIVMFLTTILTENQAFELLKAYPNIVELIMQGKADEVDLSRLHGIGESTFERIKNKVIENFGNMELLSFFGGAVSLRVIEQIRETYPSIESVKKLFKKDPYEFLMEFQRVSFITADKYLLQMQKEQDIFHCDLKTSEQRCLAYIKFKLKSIAEDEGSSKYSLKALKDNVDTNVPSCAQHFLNCIKNQAIWYDAENDEVALAYLRDIEKENAEAIRDALQHPVVWDIDVEQYRNAGDVALTDEQLKGLEALCKNNMCVINGNAGSGKSFSTQAIIKMLENNRKTVALMAPTARAARVLSGYTNRPASTIHRGYGYTPSKGWAINKNQKLGVDVLIIDEASMLGAILFKHVLDGLDLKRTKLLLVGDSAQLSSIEVGNVLHDLINSGAVPVTSLTKIFRYDEGGISKIATDIRNRRPYIPANAAQHKTLLYGKEKDYSFTTSSDDQIVGDIAKIYSKMIQTGRDIRTVQIITAYNKGRTGSQAINKVIQKIANKENYGKGKYIKFGENIYYKGDFVIQKKNNYQTEVYDFDSHRCTGETDLVCNGDVGEIVEIQDEHHAVIKFDDKYFYYERAEFVDIKLGYAISVHSSQGSQSDTVIFATPKSQTFMMSSNLLYVGCTRSKKRCIQIGDPDMVRKAVYKKDEQKRNTFLCDFLSSNRDK